MTDKALDLSLRAGHRERLRKNFLDGNLAKYEVLELLLSYAIPRRDVRPLARMLFKKFGGMYPILSASIDDLCKVPGMGRNTAIFIKTIQKVMLDGYHCEAQDVNIFQNREHFENYCKLMLGGKPIEEMHVLYMDADHRLIQDQLHSIGSHNDAAIYPTEVVKQAMLLNARFIALIHNHPRAQTSFSKEDVAVTRDVIQKLDIVGIKFYDHFVVSGGILYSMRECGLLNSYSSINTSNSLKSGISTDTDSTGPES
jgi:DNA repair protein RadC